MAALKPPSAQPPTPRGLIELDELTIRFAGDASDGMQLVGMQFAFASSQCGNTVGTLPDHPAEIRALAGTLPNVAGFQVHVATTPSYTPGDVLHALVAMNPAALKANLSDLAPGGILVVNTDTFTTEELGLAGYAHNPLDDGSLSAYRIFAVPMAQHTREAVARVNLTSREADRCKNFFALGFVCWLYQRPLEPAQRWIREIYAKNPAMIEANTRTLKAGYQHGEASAPVAAHRLGKAEIPPGRYRFITGTDALAAGLLAAAHQTKRPLVFSCFPLPPASDLLHKMVEQKQLNVKIVQAEDDLAALQMAIGAAFGGALGVTATTGPGLSLQSESLGLAVMTELPCVLIDVQRAGPSSGMPSKTEQADLLQALHGRHGDCPLVVLAVATPGDSFALVQEAVRLAIRFMTPVVVLTDTYLAHSAESWRIPDLHELPAIDVPPPPPLPTEKNGTAPFLPYRRNDLLARPWAIPGTPGLEHRTGGLEKEDRTGNVSYDPVNHEWMVQTRARKIALVADEIPPLTVHGAPGAQVLVLGWGSTYGVIRTAVEPLRAARSCRWRAVICVISIRCRKTPMTFCVVTLEYSCRN